MKKNNINIYYMQKIFFLLIICLFILTGCNNKNDDEKLKSKIRDQISYLEKDLISMLNDVVIPESFEEKDKIELIKSNLNTYSNNLNSTYNLIKDIYLDKELLVNKLWK